jgi:hypothetical protein
MTSIPSVSNLEKGKDDKNIVTNYVRKKRYGGGFFHLFVTLLSLF